MPNPNYPTMHVSDEFVEKMNAKREAEKKVVSAVPFNIMSNTGADLSQWCGSVFDQQSEGSCTACTTRDYLLWLENKYAWSSIIDPAVNAIYYYGRFIYGDLSTDGGAMLHDSMQGTVTYGVIPTEDELYNPNTLYTQPPLSHVEFKATNTQSINANTANIRSTLDAGKPVGISVAVMQTLFSPVNGIVDTSTTVPNEGHAIFCCTYKTDSKYGYLYKFQNSWGTSYGQSGYAWFTEAYLTACLWEVCTLDIPNTFPNPQPNPTNGYTLTIKSDLNNIPLNTKTNVAVKLLNNNIPVANQIINIQIKRNSGIFTPSLQTDINGQVSIPLTTTIVETITIIASYTDSNNKVYTNSIAVNWIVPIVHNYKVTATFQSSTAIDGANDNVVVSTFDGTTPVPSQNVGIQIKRSGQTYTPLCITDSITGSAIIKLVSTTEEKIEVDCTWVTPDNTTCTATAIAQWNKPIPVPPTLVSISINPTILNLNAGANATISANALYSDNSTQDISQLITCSTPTTGVLTFSGNTITSIGKVTGNYPVTVSYGGKSVVLTVSVTVVKPVPPNTLYHVLSKPMKKIEDADALAVTLNSKGFNTYTVHEIQCGAMSILDNATKLQAQLKALGIDTYIAQY